MYHGQTAPRKKEEVACAGVVALRAVVARRPACRGPSRHGQGCNIASPAGPCAGGPPPCPPGPPTSAALLHARRPGPPASAAPGAPHRPPGSRRAASGRVGTRRLAVPGRVGATPRLAAPGRRTPMAATPAQERRR
jgi:hypothetical protein